MYQEDVYNERGGLDNLRFMLEPSDAGYPERLRAWPGRRVPGTLTGAGDPALFSERPLVMICGARDASPRALELAGVCASRCGHERVTVVSGFARGVDMIAHRKVLLESGSTIAVLPFGMNRFRYGAELHEYIAEGRFCAVSAFSPASHFTVNRALRRNRIMAALSDAVIVVEPGDTGGTWSSASAAAEFSRQLFYIAGDRPECEPKLRAIGAQPIPADADGMPDMAAVLDTLDGKR